MYNTRIGGGEGQWKENCELNGKQETNSRQEN